MGVNLGGLINQSKRHSFLALKYQGSFGTKVGTMAKS